MLIWLAIGSGLKSLACTTSRATWFTAQTGPKSLTMLARQSHLLAMVPLACKFSQRFRRVSDIRA